MQCNTAMKKVTIYTDGACSGNPGVGGWGAILMYGAAKKEVSGAEARTTNNRMELTAAISALNCLKEPCEVELFTDSAYLCNSFNLKWIYGWIGKDWKTAAGKPVENKDLWLELIRLNKLHTIRFYKVKGHADNEFNNRCDQLARSAVLTIKKQV